MASPFSNTVATSPLPRAVHCGHAGSTPGSAAAVHMRVQVQAYQHDGDEGGCSFMYDHD